LFAYRIIDSQSLSSRKTRIQLKVITVADTKTSLLDAAAQLVQTRGYNGFSFHDLAEAVGIRTASIHYHFPTKADLGQALVTRYTADFLALLSDPDGAPEERLRTYVGLFRQSLASGRMCLCGMIGAEVSGVPEELGQSVRAFFTANETWLAQVYEQQGLARTAAKRRARLMLAALEGAMLIARTSGDNATFEDVAKEMLALGKSA
jgi:TetR/AcrR family transcriptional regulator, transcriptional repressor for nem operon